MSAYEMMLSESQERMLMVLHPEKEDEARAIFSKWDLDFAIVGETIPEDRFLVIHGGQTRADLPLRALSGEAPEYDRPWVPTPAPAPLGPLPEIAPANALLELMAHPDFCSRAWVWEQYDSEVMADTVKGPGGDAGVVRIHGTARGLAFSSDVTPRYCLADPVEGGRQAVAECYRNLCAAGAKPLAATDNLNFGNPERPEIMGQLVGGVTGIGEACRALDFPIVSGNVSLYNETDGRAILPTPTIAGVGLIGDLAAARGRLAVSGDWLVMLGECTGHLGQSALLHALFGRAEGAVPPVDLAGERAAGTLVRALIERGLVGCAHDLSDGGLALAAAEMALSSGVGVVLDAAPGEPLGWFFGEDQGRYLLTVDDSHMVAVSQAAAEAGVPIARVGAVGGGVVALGGSSVPLETLRAAHRDGFARLMGEHG
jgi:phosphoribosylformylglycinamidine synthase